MGYPPRHSSIFSMTESFSFDIGFHRVYLGLPYCDTSILSDIRLLYAIWDITDPSEEELFNLIITSIFYRRCPSIKVQFVYWNNCFSTEVVIISPSSLSPVRVFSQYFQETISLPYNLCWRSGNYRGKKTSIGLSNSFLIFNVFQEVRFFLVLARNFHPLLRFLLHLFLTTSIKSKRWYPLLYSAVSTNSYIFNENRFSLTF